MALTDRRTSDGRRLYACDGPECGATHEPWGDQWLWFGSIRDSEERPERILTFCGPACVDAFRAQQAGRKLPRLKPSDLRTPLCQELTEHWQKPMRGRHHG